MKKRKTVLAALWLCFMMAGEGLALEDLPALPQQGSSAAFLQPVLAEFSPGQRYEVYSGPGKEYLREANGRAMVSTNDWIQVFGEEEGWLFVLYRVSENAMRFGYIEATPRQAQREAKPLAWQHIPVRIYGNGTNDPLGEQSPIDVMRGHRGEVLAEFGDGLTYVQTLTADGAAVRLFVKNADVDWTDQSRSGVQGMLYIWDRSEIPAYRTLAGLNEGSAPEGMLAAGMSVYVLEREENAALIETQSWGSYWVSASSVIEEL